MNMILEFPLNIVQVGSYTGKTPETGADYLKICKRVLEQDDYEDVLLAIMDYDIYDQVEPHIQNIVDSFYNF